MSRHGSPFRVKFPEYDSSLNTRKWQPIFWPANLTDNGNIDPAWAAEMKRLKYVFFSELGSPMHWSFA